MTVQDPHPHNSLDFCIWMPLDGRLRMQEKNISFFLSPKSFLGSHKLHPPDQAAACDIHHGIGLGEGASAPIAEC